MRTPIRSRTHTTSSRRHARQKANPLAKEMYLGDEEFKKVFGCDKEAFYALRAWRRRELKRQARLY